MNHESRLVKFAMGYRFYYCLGVAILFWIGWCFEQVNRHRIGTLISGNGLLICCLLLFAFALSDRKTPFGSMSTAPGERVDTLTLLAVTLPILLFIPLILDLGTNTALARLLLNLIGMYACLMTAWMILQSVYRRWKQN